MPQDFSVHEVKGEASEDLRFGGGGNHSSQPLQESGVAASQEEDGEVEEGESANSCREVPQEVLQSPRGEVQAKERHQEVSSLSQPLQAHAE